MTNFCTYFDSYYMLKGLSLYTSLERVCKTFHMYVMALDKECFYKLKSLSLKYMTVELLSNIETPELLAVKPTRSRGEYCWTCGPSIILYFLTCYNLDSITYLDSDLMFFSDPNVVFEEVSDSSIAITEQGVDEKTSRTYGRYCVQYITFRNDENGLGALTWWKNSCIEWCFQKIEKNRYGDQKYLDEFPKKWRNVHVIKNIGAGIAPWNMHKYKYEGNQVILKGKRYPIVFFHFHGVKIEIVDDVLHVSSLHNELNNSLIKSFYDPYAELLKEVLATYYGFKIRQTIIHDMPLWKKVDYRLRAHLRNNSIIRWVWFSLLRKKDSGHGTKF